MQSYMQNQRTHDRKHEDFIAYHSRIGIRLVIQWCLVVSSFPTGGNLIFLKHLYSNFVPKWQKCQICVIYENLDLWWLFRHFVQTCYYIKIRERKLTWTTTNISKKSFTLPFVFVKQTLLFPLPSILNWTGSGQKRQHNCFEYL